MKEIREFLYGKQSKEKMELFFEKIKELNDKYELKDNNKIENMIIINWNAGKNKNVIKITGLNKTIKSQVIDVFDKIFS